jgi:hypothetical protein
MHPGVPTGVVGRCFASELPNWFILEWPHRKIRIAYDPDEDSDDDGAYFGAYLDDLQISDESLSVDSSSWDSANEFWERYKYKRTSLHTITFISLFQSACAHH